MLITLTACCILGEVVCGSWLHLAWPYNWPLMPRHDSFRDLTLYQSRFAYFHSARFFTFDGPAFLYPAPLAVVYRILYLFPHPVAVSLGVFVILFLAAGVGLGQALVARGLSRGKTAGLLVAMLACSYPLFFELEQANVEWVVWALLAGGIWAFLRGLGYTAGVCFGIAGAMKIYPLLFVGLLLSRRQYRQALVCAMACVATTIASLWLVCPDLGVSWRGTQTGIAFFRYWYMLRYEQVGFDHSLYAGMKAAWLLVTGAPMGQFALALLLGFYVPVTALAGLILYFDVIRKLPIVNQVICLVVASIVLPPVSYDYTLIHLYVPLCLLLLIAFETPGRGVTGALTCLAVAIAPETEFIFRGHSYGGQIKCVALIALSAIALRHPFASRFDDVAAPSISAHAKP